MLQVNEKSPILFCFSEIRKTSANLIHILAGNQRKENVCKKILVNTCKYLFIKFGLLESSRGNSDFLLYLRISNDVVRLILISLQEPSYYSL